MESKTVSTKGNDAEVIKKEPKMKMISDQDALCSFETWVSKTRPNTKLEGTFLRRVSDLTFAFAGWEIYQGIRDSVSVAVDFDAAGSVARVQGSRKDNLGVDVGDDIDPATDAALDRLSALALDWEFARIDAQQAA